MEPHILVYKIIAVLTTDVLDALPWSRVVKCEQISKLYTLCSPFGRIWESAGGGRPYHEDESAWSLITQ